MNTGTKALSCLANSAGIFYNEQEKEGRLLFNIGFAELLLVLVIAYVIVGPKDLPRVARWLGRMVRRARQLIREIKSEVGWDEMMAETEDVRRDIDSLYEAIAALSVRPQLPEKRNKIGFKRSNED